MNLSEDLQEVIEKKSQKEGIDVKFEYRDRFIIP
ncbi:putative uncharacterized protein [Waddlia chondrophila 2032/99]|uniref:Uncharacterized protein n=2 Tax=Waddlia chondrophila TaxID=71667 RepID=D6YUR6_WADCW|nr:hypothetical protein wcw_0506 [Waddlia chondrophila WSU 86-1044]CCB91247.1 putative uncharacterized protein [Waddlia chondrophila 2032/99]